MGVSTIFEFLGTEPFRLTVTQLVLDCLGFGTRRSALVSSRKRGHAIVYARFDDELAATVQARATDTARYEFDPAGFSQDTEFALNRCGAELKHARFAILAWLNLVVPGVSRIPFPGEQQLPRRLLGGRASASASASGGPSASASASGGRRTSTSTST